MSPSLKESWVCKLTQVWELIEILWISVLMIQLDFYLLYIELFCLSWSGENFIDCPSISFLWILSPISARQTNLIAILALLHYSNPTYIAFDNEVLPLILSHPGIQWSPLHLGIPIQWGQFLLHFWLTERSNCRAVSSGVLGIPSHNYFLQLWWKVYSEKQTLSGSVTQSFMINPRYQCPLPKPLDGCLYSRPRLFWLFSSFNVSHRWVHVSTNQIYF